MIGNFLHELFAQRRRRASPPRISTIPTADRPSRDAGVSLNALVDPALSNTATLSVSAYGVVAYSV